MDPKVKNRYIIAGVSFVIIIVAIYFLFLFDRKPKGLEGDGVGGEVREVQEIDLKDRPYVTLTPTSDGAEIIISIENMSFFDKLEYELTYLADNPQIPGERIQRGSTGQDINPKEEKYKKPILLGTASKGTRSPDKGITDGKLTMHMYKGETEYQSETPWTFIQAGSKTGTIEDVNKKFALDLPSLSKDYWIILADTLGVPPKDRPFEVENVLLPSYGAFSTAPNDKSAKIKITLDGDVPNPQVHSFDPRDSSWKEISAEYDSFAKAVSFSANPFDSFVLTSPK